MKIFLSYAREDQVSAASVHQVLQNAGFQPWMDIRDLIAGSEWEHEIERQIRHSDIFIIFLSTRSVEKRGVLQREIPLALRKAEEHLPGDIFILPILIEDCEPPDSLRRFQWLDLRRAGWELGLIRAIIEAQRQRYGEARFSLEGGSSYPIVTEEVKESNDDGEIQYELPRILIPGDERRAREVNDVVVGAIRHHVLHYRGMFEEWDHKPADSLGSYVDLSVLVAMCNSDFFSMEIAIHNYFEGAAHPTSYFESLNIFIPAVRLVTRDSVFAHRTDYMKFLQQECAFYISREFDGELDVEYALEHLSNDWVTFEKFTITQGGLTFLFGEVLAHVYGPQIATIEGSKLIPFLRKSELSDRLAALWSTAGPGNPAL